MSKPRFAVVLGSQSGHCCFEATVTDTTKPLMAGHPSGFTTDMNGKKWENPLRPAGYDEAVCECFSVEDAQMIADALNDTERP